MERIGGGQEKMELSGGIIRFENVNVSDVGQMESISRMLKDPENMKHLADISLGTKIEDLVEYYSDGRLGIVALGESGEAVGVLDIASWGPQVVGEGDRTWYIQSGMLGRLCVQTEKQKEGRGTKLVAYAEEVGLSKYPSLRAGIILDDVEKERCEQALEKDAENEFRDWFRGNDARGKLFLRNRGWRYAGVFRNQGGFVGEGKFDNVVIIEKTRGDLEEEKLSRK